jgi:MFS family permease
MDNQIVNQPKSSWTWADMFVTYRFWGLILLYIFSLASSGLVNTWLTYFLREIYPSGPTLLTGLLSYTLAMSILLGFFLAWAATRYETKILLLIAIILQLVGGFVLTYGSLQMFELRYLGAILCGIGIGAITLGVPAVLAGGKGGAQAFVVAFGLLFVMSRISDLFLPSAVGSLWDRYGSGTLAIGMVALTLLGLIFLLPVKSELFTKPPKARVFQWVVKPRNPVLVGLGSILAPIYYYFVYKFHGEVTSLRPSPKILSPMGALFTLLIFPFAFSAIWGILLGATFIDEINVYLWLLVIAILLIPLMLMAVILTTLVEPLNELAEAHGKKAILAPWVVFVLSVLLLPVAMGLIQWAINRSILITEQESTQPVAGNEVVGDVESGIS